MIRVITFINEARVLDKENLKFGNLMDLQFYRLRSEKESRERNGKIQLYLFKNK